MRGRRWVLMMGGAFALVVGVDIAASYFMVAVDVTPPPFGLGDARLVTAWPPFWVVPPWLSLVRLVAYALVGVVGARWLGRGRSGAILVASAWVFDSIGSLMTLRGHGPGMGALCVGLAAAMGWLWPQPAVDDAHAWEFPTQSEMLDAIAATGIGPVATVPDLRVVTERTVRRGLYERRCRPGDRELERFVGLRRR